VTRFLIINEDPQHISARDYADAIEALNLAMPAFCAAHDLALSEVVAATSASEAKPGDIVAHWTYKPDVANAGGYHSTSNHVPFIESFTQPYLDNGGSIIAETADAFDMSAFGALSHEVWEAKLDPPCNLYATMGPKRETALEASDAGEDIGFPVKLKSGRTVYVSTFLTPAWFERGAPGPYDHTDTITGPFKLSPKGGGYMIVQHLIGGETQVTSDAAEGSFDDADDLQVHELGEGRKLVAGPNVPAWKIELKKAHGRVSRRARRHAA
jgi:hypothetical protein